MELVSSQINRFLNFDDMTLIKVVKTIGVDRRAAVCVYGKPLQEGARRLSRPANLGRSPARRRGSLMGGCDPRVAPADPWRDACGKQQPAAERLAPKIGPGHFSFLTFSFLP
ncbi:MAG TPA: hypothetical protein VE029_13690 [Rhizobacter sp.]|nr:hypothetical protein [Rhizobacter sp.]